MNAERITEMMTVIHSVDLDPAKSLIRQDYINYRLQNVTPSTPDYAEQWIKGLADFYNFDADEFDELTETAEYLAYAAQDGVDDPTPAPATDPDRPALDLLKTMGWDDTAKLLEDQRQMIQQQKDEARAVGRELATKNETIASLRAEVTDYRRQFFDQKERADELDVRLMIAEQEIEFLRHDRDEATKSLSEENTARMTAEAQALSLKAEIYDLRRVADIASRVE